jgi:hypothetical protein
MLWARALVLALCSFLPARAANAVLIELDLLAPGDGLITRDTNTGQDWLDWTATTGLSVLDILGGSGGWAALGFRYAVSSEVCSLISTYGEPMTTCPGSSTASGDAVGALQAFLGITSASGTSRRTMANFDDGDFLDRDAGFATLVYLPLTNNSLEGVSLGSNPTTTVASSVGSALVRPVPEPSTALLVSAGVSLLAARRLVSGRRTPTSRTTERRSHCAS